MSQDRRRVAITGMGVKTPAGNDLDSFWSTIVSAESQAAPWTLVDGDVLPVKFGCEVKDFDPTAYLNVKEARRQDRVAQLGFAAAMDAYKQAGEIGADPARCAVVGGTGVGGLITLEAQVTQYAEKGADRVSPFLVPMMMTNATGGLISIQLGWTGPSFTVTTACAAGANAIGEAGRLIREGSADVVLRVVAHPDGHLRLRPHGGPLGPQRRAHAGVAPLRRRPRRLRDGRGRRLPGARGVRPGRGPGRHHPR
jgi:3-oxoacyl-[acyl-carrier-protein] synthase II